MEIGYLVDKFPSLSETFILNQLSGLIERGHSVHIFAVSRGRDPVEHAEIDRYELLSRTRYFHQAPGPGRRLRVAAQLLGCSLGSPAIAFRSLNPMRFGLRGASLQLLQAALECRDSPNLDILHCHYGPIGVLGSRLREVGVLRAPIVTTFHGFDIRLAESDGPDVYRSLRESSDAVIAISSGNRRKLEKLGFAPERIYDHPVGIEFKRFPFRWADASPSSGKTVEILTVGRLVWEKGHQYALEALCRVQERNPQLEWRYRIIGDGPNLDALMGRVARLGLQERVEFCGAQPAKFVREALGQAEVFLLPSVAEVLPVVLMEAAASGLPIVASDVGSVGDIVEDGVSGHLVRPRDPEALATRLEQLMSVPERWEDMGRAGRDRVAVRFDVDILNDRLVEIFHRVAGLTT